MTWSAVYSEDFSGGSLAAGWTRRGVASETVAGGALTATLALGQGYQRALADVGLTAGQDFEVEVGILTHDSTAAMLGAQAFDGTGFGMSASVYTGPQGIDLLGMAAGHGYNSGIFAQCFNVTPPTANVYMRLRKVGSVWSVNYSTDGVTWGAESPATLTQATTVTAVGFGALAASVTAQVTHFVVRADVIVAGVTPETNLRGLPLNASARLVWDAQTPAASHDYRVDGGSTSNVSPGTNGVTVSGLTNGTLHFLEARPKNASGTVGAWTGVYVRPTASTYLLDLTTRADSAVAPGSPDVGGPYTVRSGTAGISGNRLYFPTANATAGGTHLTFPAHANVDMTMRVTSTWGVNGAGLIFRWVDVSNFWVAGGSTAAWYCVHYKAGVATSHATNFTFRPPQVGDVLRVVTSGRWVFVYVNGTLIFHLPDEYFSVAAAVAGVSVRDTTTRIDLLHASAGVLPTNPAGEMPDWDGVSGDNPVSSAIALKGFATAALDLSTGGSY